MSELTEDQKKYLEQNKEWVASQKNYINGFVIGIRNAKDMVSHHSEYLKITEPQLEKELTYLKDALEVFINYCKENNIEVPDWAKA